MKFFLLGLSLLVSISSSFGQKSKATLLNSPAFEQALAKNLRFPAVAQQLGQSVRTYVGFTVSAEGHYHNVAVINRGPVDESLRQEVERLWQVLPRQDPHCAGNYVIPIAFLLGEGGTNRSKPIINQEDTFTKQGSYTLLREVAVTGYVVCEYKTFSNR